MDLLPMEDKIIVKKQDKQSEKVSAGGIIVPVWSEEDAESPFTGTVLAIGPGDWTKTNPPVRIPMTVKVGDTVIYSRHGHQSFRYKNEDFVTFGEASIIGIVKESTAQG